MKKVEISTQYTSCQYDELTAEQKMLVNRAKANTKRSYSPYSHFSVGAALLLANGQVVDGANQENAAYPSGLCAERTALFAAGALYPDVPVVALAVACYTHGAFLPNPGSPCGGCRQVMIETEERGGKPMQVLLYGENETWVLDSAKSLMPLSFDGSVLD